MTCDTLRTIAIVHLLRNVDWSDIARRSNMKPIPTPPILDAAGLSITWREGNITWLLCACGTGFHVRTLDGPFRADAVECPECRLGPWRLQPAP